MKYAFMNLFIGIPSLFNVKSVLATELQECLIPSRAVQRLIPFLNALIDARHRFSNACSASFDSQFHKSTSNVSALIFFQDIVKKSHLIDSFQQHEYFIELAMKSIIFNNVSHTKLQQVVTFLREVLIEVTTLQEIYCETWSEDTQYCDCDDYGASGDCYCQSMPPTKVRCLSLPDISDPIVFD